MKLEDNQEETMTDKERLTIAIRQNAKLREENRKLKIGKRVLMNNLETLSNFAYAKSYGLFFGSVKSIIDEKIEERLLDKEMGIEFDVDRAALHIAEDCFNDLEEAIKFRLMEALSDGKSK